LGGIIIRAKNFLTRASASGSSADSSSVARDLADFSASTMRGTNGGLGSVLTRRPFWPVMVGDDAAHAFDIGTG
jgi:hypothetical protein